ncbi:helix-turn-helix transcriptional regulator [Nocardiopsis flavescens]|nr:HTH domain-containing protein [Nocardiopsis flavescens]
MPNAVQLHQALPLVERRHAIIEHLRARRPEPTTVRRPADLIGVSPHTIERDAARLREAGIPLETVTGLHGGYRISARTHDLSVSLSPGEVSAPPSAPVAVGPFGSAGAQSAFAKLTDALAPSRESPGTPPQP